jgi:CubicO group peptidase (beta-lactamase class C family)
MVKRSSLRFLFCVVLVSKVLASPLDPAKLGEIDDAIQKAIGEKRLPGAVVWVEHGTEIYWKAYGNRSLVPTVETMTPDTIFDVASLTKVLAGTPAIMLLVERGQSQLGGSGFHLHPGIHRRKGHHYRARVAYSYFRFAAGR